MSGVKWCVGCFSFILDFANFSDYEAKSVVLSHKNDDFWAIVVFIKYVYFDRQLLALVVDD